MPLELLRLRPEFQSLNLAQQKFIIIYVGIGYSSAEGTYDAVRAVTKAYGKSKSSLPNATVRAHQIMRNKHVLACLDIHFGVSPLQRLLEDIQRAAKKSSRLGLLSPAVGKALIAFEEYVAAQEEHQS